jgi:hypothetical protein
VGNGGAVGRFSPLAVAWRYLAEARTFRFFGCGTGLPDEARAVSASAHPIARQTLPVDRPPRRGPRYSCAGARRLRADSGNAGDRRGADAARGPRRDKGTQPRSRGANAASICRRPYGQALPFGKGFAARGSRQRGAAPNPSRHLCIGMDGVCLPGQDRPAKI